MHWIHALIACLAIAAGGHAVADSQEPPPDCVQWSITNTALSSTAQAANNCGRLVRLKVYCDGSTIGRCVAQGNDSAWLADGHDHTWPAQSGIEYNDVRCLHDNNAHCAQENEIYEPEYVTSCAWLGDGAGACCVEPGTSEEEWPEGCVASDS